jgi:hypothetical protein
MPKTWGGGDNCIIIIPANVATPIITGGNSNCFFPIFFVGFVGLNRRLGIVN